MGVRAHIAQGASGILTWGLRHIAHRPAANLPGIVGLAIDSALIRELRGRIRQGSVVVVGTNGKTTVTNLIADVMERAGRSVVCNRTGANLKSGVASALLHTRGADWGVLECDELWSAKVLPDLQPTHMVLLNLFRDQLDRCGEIDRIQDAIVSGLVASPNTLLIYNADDPLCQMVARRVTEERAGQGAACVPFGVIGSMHLAQNVVRDATMCQACSSMLAYDYRQYGQLGAYTCPHCGFTRPSLTFAATNVHLHARGLDFDITEHAEHAERAGRPVSEQATERANSTPTHLSARLSGSYMVYNLLVVFAASVLTGCTPAVVQAAINAFDPKNGRLQEYCVQGRRTLLNLAKNPTGFNQNLRIVGADQGPRVVAFFINDRDVDGHDISWIWDIDFEELLAQPNIQAVFAGGERKRDLQVRLKYAGVSAQLTDGIEDVFARIQTMPNVTADAAVYAIANYTALPPVHAALDKLAETQPEGEPERQRPQASAAEAPSGSASIKEEPAPEASAPKAPATESEAIQIVHMLPDLLNLYGDGGNVRVLAKRLEWRGIPVCVREVRYGEQANLDVADLVFIGGSPDREQRLASEQLGAMRDELAAYVDADGPVLAICGGYQMLGRTWLLDGEEVPGLDILPLETRRPGTSADRLVDNIALASELAGLPVIGYENHAGRTVLDAGVHPFGRVISRTGHGNGAEEGGQAVDGVRFRNVVGTYLHGPLLTKNPEVADWLLARALERHAARRGEEPAPLTPLKDDEERAANAYMAHRIIS